MTHGDNLLAQRIFEVIGYLLVSDSSKKYFFLFQGAADSGKSILANFIRGCFNPEATVSLNFEELTRHFAPANLVGKQFCLSMDLPSSPIKAKSASVFKGVTGGDYLSADVKYKDTSPFSTTQNFCLVRITRCSRRTMIGLLQACDYGSVPVRCCTRSTGPVSFAEAQRRTQRHCL